MLFLDLDQFKIVNDSAGHVAGDELLRQVSALLAGQLRNRDTLGRMGGDEFAVLLENCPLAKATRVADMLIEAIREYRFVWDQKTYRVGVSVGVVPIRAESESRERLMHDADQACYAAKDQGRNRAHVYSEAEASLVSRLGEKLQRKDIDDALADERFLLLYQPVVALQGDATSQQQVEVLLRMLGENDQVITPGAFLPSASRFGLMVQIDRWVIQRVLRRYAHLFVQQPELVVGFNLSATTIADESLAEFITQLLDKSVIRPEQLCFEMSEASFSQNPGNATRLIRELRELGCSLAIDNFGSGLASLSAFKESPVDFLKIDGHLIRDIGQDAVDLTMVEAINTMAHQLGIRTIAENLDSPAALERVRSIGMDFAQGYYLGDLRPLDELGENASSRVTAEFQLN